MGVHWQWSPLAYGNTHNEYAQMYNTISWHRERGGALVLPSREAAVGNITDGQLPMATSLDLPQYLCQAVLPPNCPQTVTEHSRVLEFSYPSQCGILPRGQVCLMLPISLAKMFSVLCCTSRLCLLHSSFSSFMGVRSAACSEDLSYWLWIPTSFSFTYDDSQAPRWWS